MSYNEETETSKDTASKDTAADPTLLLISGSKGNKQDDKEYVKSIANAIIQVFLKHNSVRMRCVGAAANNNAIKAFIVAKADALKRDYKFVMDPSFTTVNFQGDEKTAILWQVYGVQDFCKNVEVDV
jgi:stage V sporulation protein SpoVS